MKQMISSLSPGLMVETSAAKVSCSMPRVRFALRARDALDAIGEALGIALPTSIGERAKNGTTEAMCVGPDEWILLADDTSTLEASSNAIYATHPHSLVDISGREVTLEIEGERATELLTIGMARDPQSIPVGGGRRTVFDGVTVSIWRDDHNKYRMNVWNSFALHIGHLLATGCHELAAEAR